MPPLALFNFFFFVFGLFLPVLPSSWLSPVSRAGVGRSRRGRCRPPGYADVVNPTDGTSPSQTPLRPGNAPTGSGVKPAGGDPLPFPHLALAVPPFVLGLFLETSSLACRVSRGWWGRSRRCRCRASLPCF